MSNDDIRKYLDVLQKGNTKVLNEDGYPDVDDPDTGRETKVEVEFKDNDQIEVEVYAQGVDELKRLMDLAGVFHKDKQDGEMTPISGDQVGGPDDVPGLAPDVAPVVDPMVGPSDDSMVEPASEPMAGDDMGLDVEPEALPTGGPEVPVDIEPEVDTGPELDFDLSTESKEADEEPIEEDETEAEALEEVDAASVGTRHDYGHPNPNLGQEGYDLDAFAFSGNASKPVRFVPARSGDNPMVDSESHKGLREYIEEIAQEKKEISEVNPEKIDAITAVVTKNLPPQEKRRYDAAAKKYQQDVERKPGEVEDKNAEQVAADIAASDEAELSDPAKKRVSDEASKLGAEFDEGERKRRYSFKQDILPFQGLTGVQRVRRAALRKSRSALRK